MIVLTLPYPISANRYWASRVIKIKATGMWAAMTYVTREAEDYRAEVARIAIESGIKEPLKGRYGLHLRLFPHRPLNWKTRMRKFGDAWDDDVQCIDLGNAEKVLGDALQGVVYANDKKCRRMFLERMEPDEHGARVIVAIEQLATEQRQGDLLATA